MILMSNNIEPESDGINRRTLLKTAAVASGTALVGSTAFSGLAGAKPAGKGRDMAGAPCHKDFACVEDGIYVKLEFDDEACEFVEETETGLVTIDDYEYKDEDACEPIAVSWTIEGGYAASVMAFGGQDCDVAEDPDGYFAPELVNGGGNQAAISNLQFCVLTLPECPFYGTSRADPTAIWSIRRDPDSGQIVEEKIKDITEDTGDSNYPNGLAFDDENDVWYFAERGGVLNTMNEDGCLGIKRYSTVSDGQNIAGATFYDGGYYFTPQGGDTLYRVTLDGGSPNVEMVCADLPLGGKTFGDLAVDTDTGIAYFSVNGAFLYVNLADCTDSGVIVESTDRTAYAVLSQIAFADGTLFAHNANGGAWRIVDTDTGELGEIVSTTREYTDIAQAGCYELSCEE